ncbi:hypothetical protein OBBRIDRAFT_783489 [Obba rivulosa]|uniref:RING-type domain-containing protein n=1 Tax=Obba rivulosa TaxID=1052685 RepID=A0A8E2AKN7_9APHY|nr:hypothetical protein OBBRIDRAFT_783489 [Obba rivulosa]
MSSSTLRPMASSSQLIAPNHRAPDVVRVAPYLTHVVTHHGQLTLIPPQNAGRIRKPKKKATDPSHTRSERRYPDEEPRFTTAVPASSSKRLYPAPAQPRPRKQVAAPVTSRPFEGIAFPDEPPIPDYPPPSFQEAISSTGSYEPGEAPVSPVSTSALSVQAALAPSVSSPSSATSSQGYSSPTTSSQPVPSPESTVDADDSDLEDSSVEVVALEPAEQWEADREMGVPLVERVARERQRLESANSSTAPGSPLPSRLHTSLPRACTEVSPQRPCSHCGSQRPLDSQSDARSPDDSGDERNEHVFEPAQPGSPRTHFVRRMAPHFLKKENASSAPPSPLASSPTIMNVPSPWASSLTLSMGNPSSSTHKAGPLSLPFKKDGLGVRRLFGSKTKEKERDAAQTRPDADVDEPLDTWEVLDRSEMDPQSQEPNVPTRPGMAPKPKKDRYTMTPQAFIERPVRRPGAPYSNASQPPARPSLVLARGPALRPEKSPLRPRPVQPLRPQSDTTFPDHPIPRTTPSGAPFAQSPVRTSPASRASPNVTWRPLNDNTASGARSNSSPASPLQTVPPVTPVGSTSAPAPSVAEQSATHDIVSAPPTAPAQVGDFVIAADASPSLIPTPLHRHAAIRSRRSTDQHRETSPDGPPLSVTITPCHADPEPISGSAPDRPQPASPVSPSSPVSPGSPMTPNTPTTPNGHHYPGRPLPRPPSETSSPTTPTANSALAQPPRVEDTPVPPSEASGVSEAGEYTDLDALVARIPESRDGTHYEELLMVSEILGPAHLTPPAPRPSPEKTAPLIGRVELQRRRVTANGIVRLKLMLLGAAVDKCGICLSQFRDAEMGALGASCMHAFHERCLRRWLAASHQCPMCRTFMALEESATVRS